MIGQEINLDISSDNLSLSLHGRDNPHPGNQAQLRHPKTPGRVQRNLCYEGHRPQDGERISEIRQGGNGSLEGYDKFRIIRVFPRKTKWTPQDSLVFIGDPPLFLPPDLPVRISCVFTWDYSEVLRLKKSWSRFYSDVKVGGPAFNDCGAEFIPGLFIKDGVTITSRGCPFSCPWCFVPGREGNIRELSIKPGHIIQDNNLLACSQKHITAVFKMLENQLPAVFAGGLDSKLLTHYHVNLLKNIRIKEMWFSCDHIDNLPNLERVANLLHEFNRYQKRCYCLIGFNSESPDQAEYRLNAIYDLGFDPFAMLYRPLDSYKPKHNSKVWRDLARKWSRPAAYRTVSKP